MRQDSFARPCGCWFLFVRILDSNRQPCPPLALALAIALALALAFPHFAIVVALFCFGLLNIVGAEEPREGEAAPLVDLESSSSSSSGELPPAPLSIETLIEGAEVGTDGGEDIRRDDKTSPPTHTAVSDDEMEATPAASPIAIGPSEAKLDDGVPGVIPALEESIAVVSEPALAKAAQLPNTAEVLARESLLSDPAPWKDEPIQLIAPDSSHQRLVLSEEALALLLKVKKPITVVSAVGKFHTGKSYLLNQLLNRSTGFQLGPTVDPQTRGLWIWGSPKENGTSTAYLFLDTEGFDATGVTETYDAKIFSIATLLSDYLVYNSLRQIDQSSIEYLELLARRTQLFALKAQLNNRSVSTSVFAFPSLLWLVQDFFQELPGDQTPLQWLLRLLQSQRKRDGSVQQSGLADIFPSIDCSTLPLPHFDRDKLRRLDLLPDDELLGDYRNQIKSLREKIFRDARSRTALTGAEVAVLARVLVTAANEELFPSLPSLWDHFMDSIAFQAKGDCVALYQESLDLSLKEPLTSEELEAANLRALERCTRYFYNSMYSVDSNYDDKLAAIKADLADRFSLAKIRNERSVLEVMTAARIDSLDQFSAALKTLALPLPKTSLRQQANELTEAQLASFDLAMKDYKDVSSYASSRASLSREMRGEYAKVALDNDELITSSLDGALLVGMKGCREAFAAITEPVGFSRLSGLLESVSRAADAAFSNESIVARDETSHTAFRSQLELHCKKVFDEFREANLGRIKAHIEQTLTLSLEWIDEEAALLKFPLPIERLAELFGELHAATRTRFQTPLTDFKGDYQAGHLLKLEAHVEVLRARLVKENLASIATFASETQATTSKAYSSALVALVLPMPVAALDAELAALRTSASTSFKLSVAGYDSLESVTLALVALEELFSSSEMTQRASNLNMAESLCQQRSRDASSNISSQVAAIKLPINPEALHDQVSSIVDSSLAELKERLRGFEGLEFYRLSEVETNTHAELVRTDILKENEKLIANLCAATADSALSTFNAALTSIGNQTRTSPDISLALERATANTVSTFEAALTHYQSTTAYSSALAGLKSSIASESSRVASHNLEQIREQCERSSTEAEAQFSSQLNAWEIPAHSEDLESRSHLTQARSSEEFATSLAGFLDDCPGTLDGLIVKFSAIRAAILQRNSDAIKMRVEDRLEEGRAFFASEHKKYFLYWDFKNAVHDHMSHLLKEEALISPTLKASLLEEFFAVRIKDEAQYVLMLTAAICGGGVLSLLLVGYIVKRLIG